MSFSEPRWLWLAVALLPWLWLEWRAARRSDQALERLVGRRPQHTLLEQRMPGQRRIGVLLRGVAMLSLILGAAGPEWGRELQRRNATGSDVVFLFDVSSSMDVRDVSPSRLEEARREALAVLDQLEGSKVGVVAFAGDAVRLCPLTLDHGAVRLIIESLSSGSISEPGSDLGKGLQMAARVLPRGQRTEQAIVLWTDGEDTGEGTKTAAEDLGRLGLRAFTVGVGTPAGDIVPVLDDQGRAVDVKREEDGGPHRSHLDEQGLRLVARRTSGAYFSAARPGGELPRLLAALGTVARGGRGQRLVERPVQRFPWFAALAAFMVAWELGRAKRRLGERTLPLSAIESHPKPVTAAAALLVSLVAALPAHGQSAWARGDRAYRKEEWAVAESLYAQRARKRGPAAVKVNLATARARGGKAAEAENDLRALTQDQGVAGTEAGYNLGTLLAERQAFDDALTELRRTLERSPGDQDARFNYELALRRQQSPRSPSPAPRPQPNPSAQQQGTPQQPQPSSQSPQSQPPQTPEPSAKTPPREGLDREQAERLLGSLQELERLEQQRLRRVRVMRERRGKDW